MVKLSNCKVLGIVGSPRRGGNTEILIDEVLSGAENAGALIKKVILNNLNINPCQACDSCRKTGKCIHNDDMLELLEKMEQSDIWVLGTPIYWWGPTAQFKAFLDRWYCPNHKNFKGMKVILVIPLGGGHPNYARHTVGMFIDIFNYLDMELFETVLAPGLEERGKVREKKDILEKAYKAGQMAINKLNKS